MKIAIGSDHAGFHYKEMLRKALEVQGHEVKDFGTYSDESSDYADFAHPVSTSVESKDTNFGVLVCGSANGVAITANKHAGIRAAICWTPELASLARAHNDANIVCIPARFISEEDARTIVDLFLSTAFEGGRHARRVGKIAC
ncbi:MAG: ribose 5-phosphate isomerase B [Chryseolinea sp.]